MGTSSKTHVESPLSRPGGRVVRRGGVDDRDDLAEGIEGRRDEGRRQGDARRLADAVVVDERHAHDVGRDDVAVERGVVVHRRAGGDVGRGRRLRVKVEDAAAARGRGVVAEGVRRVDAQGRVGALEAGRAAAPEGRGVPLVDRRALGRRGARDVDGAAPLGDVGREGRVAPGRRGPADDVQGAAPAPAVPRKDAAVAVERRDEVDGRGAAAAFAAVGVLLEGAVDQSRRRHPADPERGPARPRGVVDEADVLERRRREEDVDGARVAVAGADDGVADRRLADRRRQVDGGAVRVGRARLEGRVGDRDGLGRVRADAPAGHRRRAERGHAGEGRLDADGDVGHAALLEAPVVRRGDVRDVDRRVVADV